MKTNMNQKTPKTTEIIGRPSNEPMEAIFMKKMREGRLQVINSQSLVQIQCANFDDSPPQSVKVSGSNDENKELRYSEEKIALIREWFRQKQSHNVEKYEKLWLAFKEALQSFQYHEISSIESFPDYLFLDECDLSYILHHIMKSPIRCLQNPGSFSSSELLFLEMLCLGVRDIVPFRVIRCLQEYHSQIIESMSGIKEKIHQQYLLMNKDHPPVKGAQDSTKKQVECAIQTIPHDTQIPTELNKGSIMPHIPSEEEFSIISDKLKKKLIHKEANNQKKKRSVGRPRTKKNSSTSEISHKDVEELVQKIISHISCSYLYVYPEELRIYEPKLNHK